MNLLFLCSARSWGGNEKWTLAAAEGLAARGHTVYLGARTDLFATRSIEKRLHHRRYPFAGNYDLRTVLQLCRDFRRLEIDIVLPTKQREYFLAGLAAFPSRRVKTVARLGIDRPIRNWRNRLAFCRFFDGVIVNSRSILDVLAKTKAFDSTICRVVPNGIPIPDLDPDARSRIRKELGLKDSAFAIVGVGRLTPQKGFDDAIRAFAKLPAETRLVLVGEGSHEAEYRQLAESLGVAGRVLFTGFRDDVPALLQSCDLFWLPSRSEGMPNALLEAMANGRAAVAYGVAGVREVLEDGGQGFVVPMGDIERLAKATQELIANPALRARIEREARERARTEFSPEAMVHRVEAFLAEVAARKG